MATDFTSISFDDIKGDMIDFLRSQDEFRDFVFTGAAINTLLDCLAWTGYYMTAYSNLVISESFLDTAMMRKNVLSKAIGLGYVPHQYSSAYVDMHAEWKKTGVMNPPSVIPAGTIFQTNGHNSESVWFTIRSDVQVKETETGFSADFTLREGLPIVERWVQDEFLQDRFVFGEKQLDLSDLTVTVTTLQQGIETVTYFDQFSDTRQLGPDLPTYFIQEIFDDQVEIYFGDGIVARRLKPGDTITASAWKSLGSAGNGLRGLRMSYYPGNSDEAQGWDFTALNTSYNGFDKQSRESVRITAPKWYQRQHRDVIADDYKAHLMSLWGEMAESISVWGGEDHETPYYGKVFICINPKPGNAMTSQMKRKMLLELKKTNVVTVQPLMIDPDIIQVDIDINLEWNRIKSRLNINQLKAMVDDVVRVYFGELDTLEAEIAVSKIMARISPIDDFIVSMAVNQKYIKPFTPFYDTRYTYTFRFQNQIRPNQVNFTPYVALSDGALAFWSSIRDNGEGRLDLFLEDKLQEYEVGSVDYDEGVVTLLNFKFPSSVAGMKHEVTVVPLNNNNVLRREKMFRLRNVVINVRDITAADGAGTIVA